MLHLTAKPSPQIGLDCRLILPDLRVLYIPLRWHFGVKGLVSTKQPLLLSVLLTVLVMVLSARIRSRDDFVDFKAVLLHSRNQNAPYKSIYVCSFPEYLLLSPPLNRL